MRLRRLLEALYALGFVISVWSICIVVFASGALDIAACLGLFWSTFLSNGILRMQGDLGLIGAYTWGWWMILLHVLEDLSFELRPSRVSEVLSNSLLYLAALIVLLLQAILLDSMRLAIAQTASFTREAKAVLWSIPFLVFGVPIVYCSFIIMIPAGLRLSSMASTVIFIVASLVLPLVAGYVLTCQSCV